MSVIRQIDYGSAEEFLHALMPMSDVWNPGTLKQFIFRGHADAEWKLIPTALRNPEQTNAKQRIVELMALRSFWIEADRQGLSIPGDHLKIREFWIDPTAPGLLGRELLRAAGREQWAEGIRAWPPKDLWEPLAIAQHHRVPTRFLDWTRLPMIAAYFAAIGAAEALDFGTITDGRLGVWACHENILSVSKWLDENQQYVHLVTVARSGNPNLHAQHGTFTLITPFGVLTDPPDGDPVKNLPLDETLKTVLSSCSKVNNMFTQMARKALPPLRLLTLPISEAAKLLQLLEMIGFSGATLRPGFDGAAQAANERALRDRLLKA